MKKFLSSLLLSLTVIVAVAPAYAGEPTNTCPNGQILHQYESVTGTVLRNGTPTPTNPVEPTFYQQGDMVLRKINDTYYDSYDATTGKITRRVGVKVLDGTEDWDNGASPRVFTVVNPCTNLANLTNNYVGYSNYYSIVSISSGIQAQLNNNQCGWNTTQVFCVRDDRFSDYTDFKQYLAQQYSAGTPVTVYYPLATPVEETVTSTTYCADPIKIATTAYNTAAFAPVEAALETAVTTIKDVVANTIVQADAIQNLQDTKQTMPDASGTNGTCPKFRQCLLIETDDGTPQWFPIIDPFKDFVTPILANNNAITRVDAQRRYYGDTELCDMLPKTDAEATSSGIKKCTGVGGYKHTENDNPEFGSLSQTEWGYEFKKENIGGENWQTANPNNTEGIVYGISKCVSTAENNVLAGSFARAATTAQLNHALWTARPTDQADADKYRNCWCKATAIAYNGQLYKTSAAPWVFIDTYTSAADCAYDCALFCTYYVRVDASFRQSLMGWAVE